MKVVQGPVKMVLCVVNALVEHRQNIQLFHIWKIRQYAAVDWYLLLVIKATKSAEVFRMLDG